MEIHRIVLLISILICCSLAKGSDIIVDEEFVLKLFENKGKEVSAIKATINRPQEGNLQAKTIEINWDMSNNYIKARAVVDAGKDKPTTHVLARNSKVEWRGVDMYNEAVGDAYSLILSRPEKSGIPQQIEENDYSLKWIKHLLTPYHVLEMQKISPEMLEKLEIKTEIETKRNGHAIIHLLGYVEGKLGGEVIYDVEMSDGLKIYSMENITIQPNGDKYVNVKQNFSEHAKINGIWIPSIMTEKWYDGEGKEIQSVALEILKCEINPEFTEEDFTFEPPEGSFVEDRITGMTYNIGYSIINDSGEIFYEDNSALRKLSITDIDGEINEYSDISANTEALKTVAPNASMAHVNDRKFRFAENTEDGTVNKNSLPVNIICVVALTVFCTFFVFVKKRFFSNGVG